ncbi:sulfurtransferase [Microbacterium terricola]|uniref:Sulfurtransferase n=1 Tax=Microbacterium terricola TaxID=344163 RepID=A0ABM8E267_9MICO|nr:sulfurtransferase [Microbacterium terricola]UYK40457.1 sulfurtransferase [Microbacterium terricola]BDV31821.1 sulfurtransferase [Microbacterium terricola]
MSHLISVGDLTAQLDGGRAVRLLDVRWRLDEPEGRPAYLAGHLPGAVYVDLERELTRRGHPEEGRHPLPSVDALGASLRRWGVHAGDLVVVYDDNDGVAAARAWWLLRRRGIEVSLLDGGFRAWVQAGLPLESGDRAVAPGDVELTDTDPGTVTIDEAARLPQTGILVDVRAPEHYRGRTAAFDPAAGHIPGAINIPTISHIDSAGRFRTPDEIRATLAAHGIAAGVPVALYCGSGIAATHSALAFALAGVDALVFPGSWSQWSRTRGRPISTGAEPIGAISAV